MEKQIDTQLFDKRIKDFVARVKHIDSLLKGREIPQTREFSDEFFELLNEFSDLSKDITDFYKEYSKCLLRRLDENPDDETLLALCKEANHKFCIGLLVSSVNNLILACTNSYLREKTNNMSASLRAKVASKGKPS